MKKYFLRFFHSQRYMRRKNLENRILNLAEIGRGEGEDANIILDYSGESVYALDKIILQSKYEKADFIKPKFINADANALTLGVYLGEIMLRNGLEKEKFRWRYDEHDENPVLYNKRTKEVLKPVEEVYKRITIGSLSHNIGNYYYNTMYRLCGIKSPDTRIDEKYKIKYSNNDK